MIWKYIIKGSERCHTISALWCDGRCRHGTDPECNECQEGAEGKRSLSDGRSHGVFFVPHDHTGDHFFLQRGWQPEPCHGSGAFLHLGDQYEK